MISFMTELVSGFSGNHGDLSMTYSHNIFSRH